MSPTETQLVAVYRGPVIPLVEVCVRYLGNNYETARRRAALHNLPFPAFRLDPDNRKSPWMVYAKDLAEFIDRTGAGAAAEWEKSQVTPTVRRYESGVLVCHEGKA